MEHGTRTGYTTHRCRCEACRGANADYQRARYQARADVRDQVLAHSERRRREAGIPPRQPAAPPEVHAERRRERDRASRANESPEETAARRAARREAEAALAPEERARRIELQRVRNVRYRERLAAA